MTISLRDLLSRRTDPLQLSPLTGDLGLDRPIPDSEVASPGLALAGYTTRFAPRRLHVLGETEISYLNSLSPEERRQRLEAFFNFDLPCVFVTKGQQVPDWFVELAAAAGIPVVRSALTTRDFYRLLKPFLEAELAPRTTLHGSLADVMGLDSLCRTFRYRQERMRTGPGRARTSFGGGRRGTGDSPGQRYPDRPGP